MDKAPTTAQLRDDIDSGLTGEKVGFPDPATAPLGTDAEAGGNSPTRQERALEAKSRVQYRQRAPMNGVLIYNIALVALVVAILLVGRLAVTSG